MGVIFFVYNAAFSLILLIIVLVASIIAVFAKNPDTRYQPMRDDRGSFIKSQTGLNTELDALGATARGESKHGWSKGGARIEDDDDSWSWQWQSLHGCSTIRRAAFSHRKLSSRLSRRCCQRETCATQFRQQEWCSQLIRSVKKRFFSEPRSKSQSMATGRRIRLDFPRKRLGRTSYLRR
jgi:hypothetical protein